VEGLTGFSSETVTIVMHCALWKVWQGSVVKQWPLWCTVLCGRFDRVHTVL